MDLHSNLLILQVNYKVIRHSADWCMCCQHGPLKSAPLGPGSLCVCWSLGCCKWPYFTVNGTLWYLLQRDVERWLTLYYSYCKFYFCSSYINIYSSRLRTCCTLVVHLSSDIAVHFFCWRGWNVTFDHCLCLNFSVYTCTPSYLNVWQL